MNCVHVLASHSRENAHGLFTLILEFYPNFPLDVQDAQGNTGESILCVLFFERRR